MTESSTPPRNLWRSTGAALLGILAIFVLSLGTDQVMHTLGVFSGWTERLHDTGAAIALSYRIVYGILGSYIAARFAPRNPMRHALALGVIGTLACVAGAIQMEDKGPLWYGIGLAATALPCAWLGGFLHCICHVKR